MQGQGQEQGRGRGAAAPAADGGLSAGRVERAQARIARRVAGHGAEVRRLVEYYALFALRNEAAARGCAQSRLPRVGPVLVTGPTASGKTHMVRCAAEELGVPLTVVNAASLTGAGWKGASVDDVLQPVAQAQAAEPGCLQVVLLDEFDKLRLRGGAGDDSSAQPSLLKLFDGGVYRGVAGDGGGQLVIDADAVLFVLAGAFSGIGAQVVGPRLRRACRSAGGGADPALEELAFCGDEGRLRSAMTAADLVSWGTMPELVGRVGLVLHLDALGSGELASLANGPGDSLERRVGRVMPEGSAFRITDGAAALLARHALDGGLGARSMESELAPLAARAACAALAAPGPVEAVVDADGGRLGLTVGEPGRG